MQKILMEKSGDGLLLRAERNNGAEVVMDIVEERVAILVVGAQYGKVIYRKIRELNVCSEFCHLIRSHLPIKKKDIKLL